MTRLAGFVLLVALVGAGTAVVPAVAQDTASASPAADRLPVSVRALLPDTILTPPAGPRTVLLGTPGSGVVALRLHVPLREGPAEAGVGRLLRELSLERMEGLARPVGARVAVTRTPWGLAYAVEGATADFEYLAYLLREAVGRPALDDVPLTRARQRLEAAVARASETPQARLAAELRRTLLPATPPLEGTPGSLASLDAARVLEAWHRSHQSPRMTLVVSAGLIPEVVLAATRGLGSAEGRETGPLEAPAPPEGRRSRVESLRNWYGRAWSGGSSDSPLGPVAALLISETLEGTTGDFETTLQLRELPSGWAILVLGAAYTRQARAMEGAVDGALDATEARLDAPTVRRVADRVRRDLLVRARTPLGLVEAVGRAMEAGGDAASAARYLTALDSVDVEAVRGFLAELRDSGSVRARVDP